MSTQYITGLETFDDGDTQARNKANANLARDSEFARENIPFHYLGQAAANKIFFRITFTHDAYLTAVIFMAHFGPPAGSSLILKAKASGVIQAQDYVLPDSAQTATIQTANETDILILAGQPLELYFSQVGSLDSGQDIRGFVLIRKVKL